MQTLAAYVLFMLMVVAIGLGVSLLAVISLGVGSVVLWIWNGFRELFHYTKVFAQIGVKKTAEGYRRS